jgi:hypothetical protein
MSIIMFWHKLCNNNEVNEYDKKNIDNRRSKKWAKLLESIWEQLIPLFL